MALLPSRALARGVIRILSNFLLFAHFFPGLSVVDAFTKSTVGLHLRHVPANEPSPLSLSMLVVQSAGQPGSFWDALGLGGVCGEDFEAHVYEELQKQQEQSFLRIQLLLHGLEAREELPELSRNRCCQCTPDNGIKNRCCQCTPDNSEVVLIFRP